MKVLLGPANIVSLLSTTAKGLRKNNNIKVKGISLWTNKYWTFDDDWLVFEDISWKSPLKKIKQIIYKNYKLFTLILWADIIHWCWDIKGNSILNFHYRLIRLLKKPVVVEWIGSDIRIPEVVFELNPYYNKVWNEGVFTYQFESYERSMNIQSRFKKINAIPLVCPEMSLFINKKLFPDFHIVFQRIDLKSYQVNYPSVDVKKPVLVHTPSALGAKGTKEMKEVLNNLHKKGFQFEYIEITNMPKKDATEAVQKADIFLDQFIIGSYGLATCEALAMGKPVFCFIMPAVKELLPKDCPIIDASLDSFEMELEKYLLNSELRRDTGIKSRQYAEKYHDTDVIALQIEKIYQNLLSG
jgi:glycosyltransferase involved in cell wall biosynthesis